MLDLTTIHEGLRACFTPNSKIVISTCIALFVAVRFYRSYSRRSRTTKLKGPPSKSFLFGVSQDLHNAPDLGAVYNDWEKTYGSTYEITDTLGLKILVLGDPKAMAHILAKDTTVYHQLKFFKAITIQLVSPDISVYAFVRATHRSSLATCCSLWRGRPTRGSSNRIVFGPMSYDCVRQRKALSFGFSSIPTRNLTSIFLDSAYKVSCSLDQSRIGDFSSTTTDESWMGVFLSIQLDGLRGD